MVCFSENIPITADGQDSKQPTLARYLRVTWESALSASIPSTVGATLSPCASRDDGV